jgi:DnaJ-related protein SCJ1
VTQPGKLLPFIRLVYGPLNFFVGYVQTVEGEGMPLYGTDNFGDLFVEYNVVLPVELNSDIRRSKLYIPRCLSYPRADHFTELVEAFYGSSHHDRDEL